jgi:hypothetical protein
MEYSGALYRVYELELPGHQCSAVQRWNRLAQDLPIGLRLALRGRAQDEVELTKSQEFFITYAASCPIDDHAVDYLERVGLLSQLFPRQLEESFAGGSGRQGKILVVEVCRGRLTPRRVALIRGARRGRLSRRLAHER